MPADRISPVAGDPVTLEGRGDVAVVTFDRPGRINAVDTGAAECLLRCLEQAAGARALVLTGSGGNFCSGWDLSEARGVRDSDSGQLWATGVARLADFPAPTLAAIEGHCLGQGLLYAICCDLRIAGEGARLGFPEVRRGFFAGSSASQRIVRVIGRARAKELMFFGNALDADTAALWGLVNQVTPRGGALESALARADELTRGPTRALAVIKRLVDEGADLPLAEGVKLERRLAAELDPAEIAEGVDAFREGRPARFPR